MSSSLRVDLSPRATVRPLSMMTKRCAQVFLDGELREDLPPLPQVADAPAYTLLGRPIDDLLAAEPDAPRLDRHQAEDRSEQRRLSHSVPSDEAGARSLRNREVHVPEGVASALERVEPRDFEHVLLSSIRLVGSRAEVDLDDARVLLHRCHLALRQHPSLVENGHRAREASHELHVVVDDHDRVLPGEFTEELRGSFRLPVGQSRDRLVCGGWPPSSARLVRPPRPPNA